MSALQDVELQAVRIATAWEQVADALRDQIIGRAWAEGQRLPVENELAARLGVSRGTLRKALRQLADEGLLVIRSGASAGTYVGSLPALPTAPLLIRILHARRVIEIPAAGHAVHSVDPEQLDAIERRRRLATVRSTRFTAYRDFHGLLLAAGSEPLWQEMAKPLFDWLGAHVEREQNPQGARITIDCDHQRIVAAVRNRNPTAACEAMSNHLDRLSAHCLSMTPAV